jgi:hypothetical protein
MSKALAALLVVVASAVPPAEGIFMSVATICAADDRRVEWRADGFSDKPEGQLVLELQWKRQGEWITVNRNSTGAWNANPPSQARRDEITLEGSADNSWGRELRAVGRLERGESWVQETEPC